MLTALGLIVFLPALAVVAMLVLANVLLPLPRWQREARPYGCAACRVDYSDARALAWHRQGMHVETYEASR